MNPSILSAETLRRLDSWVSVARTLDECNGFCIYLRLLDSEAAETRRNHWSHEAGEPVIAFRVAVGDCTGEITYSSDFIGSSGVIEVEAAIFQAVKTYLDAEFNESNTGCDEGGEWIWNVWETSC
jgi:hypothetical protein